MSGPWYGRLDPAKAQEFSRLASHTLLHTPRETQAPPMEHFEALEKIAERCEELARAFGRVQSAGLSAGFLREAWQFVAKCQDGNPAAKPFPDDLIETLRYLALAARIWQPDPKPAHAPKKFTPAICATHMLVLNFFQAFEAWPTIGSNSPFVRYCREELPKAGFECPSLDKMTAIVDEIQ